MFTETGCLNGGGQIKPKPGQSPKELSQLLEIVYMEDVSLSRLASILIVLLYFAS